MKKLGTFIILSLLVLLTLPLQTLADCEVCGDVNNSGGDPDISDFTLLIDYLLISHDPLPCPEMSDVDGLPGINLHDAAVLIDYVQIYHNPLNCDPDPDTILPVYATDTLEFRNTVIPAGYDEWAVEIWEKSSNDVISLTIPLQYGCPNDDFILESISFEGSRYGSTLNSLSNTGERKCLIYKPFSFTDVIPPGEGRIALLYFSTTPVDYDRDILIDTAMYEPEHKLIYSTYYNEMLYGYAPMIINISNPDNFTATKTRGKAPMVVRFDSHLDCEPNEYYWDFGDGGWSTDATPIYTYTGEGSYDVKLRFTYDLGGPTYVDSIIKEEYIIVTELEADFTADPTYGVAPTLVQFTDQSKGTPTSWYWEFGDGNASSGQNPTHQYDTAGVYDVNLTVNDGTFEDFNLKLDYVRVDTLFTDLQTNIYNNGPQVGLNFSYYIGYGVIGTYPAASCTLKVLPPAQVEISAVMQHSYKSGYPEDYYLDHDTIKVPLNTVEPLKWPGGTYEIECYVPLSVSNGTSLTCESWVTTPTLETDYANNYFEHNSQVGEIDPLFFKTSTPEGSGPENIINSDQRLSYKLSFENNSEAVENAQYIWVEDTLDGNFDFSTLALGDVSHSACELTYKIYNDTFCIVTGECISIDLPPNIVPGEGEGYFTFSVKPKEGLDPGTLLENRAWIYVDQIQPIPAPFINPTFHTIGGTCCSHFYEDGITGDINCSGSESPDISDITRMIDHLYISHAPLCCPDEADVNDSNQGAGLEPDISDITRLINHLYLAHEALAPCP